jgi:predicted anti-sigma-YlaC factor YlaD
VRELAPDYVSGLMDAERTAMIDAHRRECAGCHSMLDQLEDQRAQQV